VWLILLLLIVVALLVIGRTKPEPGLSTGLLFLFVAPIALLLMLWGPS
jgi:hypothetical protein